MEMAELDNRDSDSDRSRREGCEQEKMKMRQ